MSNNPAEQFEEISEQVGETSIESEAIAAPKPPRGASLGVYDLMALISAICLVVATILLVIEIRNWGQFPGFPWRVDTARATPVSSS